MTAPPTIPPRPSRAQQSSPGNTHMDVPKVPPRPKRGVDRSVSPNRDAFARSPLNDPSFIHNGKQKKESGLGVEVPARPPSVSLPALGQEGSEYASFEDLSKTLSYEREHEGSPQQTKNVGDLPLYAPTASVPSSTAKTRIQNVTRTDSNQAAAHGLGNLSTQDKGSAPDSTRTGSSAGGNTRPSSMLKDDEEQGIPEIGVQVPMYPNAGDVQAPTPAPSEQMTSHGPGFFNKGSAGSGRRHGRTKSGREIFHGPPGSYGMHGHGRISTHEFEQEWYKKHPEDLKREKAGEYGPHVQENRKDYHWTGDKLEKLVHKAGPEGLPMGTSGEAIGTPDEHVGFLASEEYASRIASPRPTSGRPSSMSGKPPHVESPLRQANFPVDQLSKSKTTESELDEDVIHIDPPSHRASKIHGGGYDPPTEDLGPEGGNTENEGGWVSERGYGVPILASDEIEKHPEAEYRQPAVSPEMERRRSGEYTAEEGMPSYITKQRPHSRSSSRNSGQPPRFVSSPHQGDMTSTPLESTKEYEPLFPEDEEHQHKPKTAADKLKRPELARHHFPSQDVWEDTPSSLQLETTVETPQAPEEPKSAVEASPAQVFEKPQSEEARKDHITKEDQQSFLPEHTKRFTNKHLRKEHLDEPTRPGMRQRFPSQDIWEDAPDHGQLETIVSTPQMDESNDYVDDSPHSTEKPTVPARPNIPARPQKNKEISPVDKKAPVLPDRPKPQVPARPGKPLTKSSEKVPTVESQATADDEAPPQPKQKPQVPARPSGGKIAALQAGFLKDLNSKLGLGPGTGPKAKESEPEEEKEPPKPLSDARKGRAKGPQRRKPTASPAPAAAGAAATVTSEVAVPEAKLGLEPVSTIWSIGESGEVEAPAAELAKRMHAALKGAQEPDVAAVEEAAVAAQESELSKTTSKTSEPGSAGEQQQQQQQQQPPLPSEASAPLSKSSTKESADTVPAAADPSTANPDADTDADKAPHVDATGNVPSDKGTVSVDEPVRVASNDDNIIGEGEGEKEAAASSEAIVR